MNNNDFTDDKVRELREAFEIFDKDQDGLLNMEECNYSFMCLGYEFSNNEIFEIFCEFATNNNRMNIPLIDFNSFLLFLNKRSKESDVEDELIECFKNFDKDGDGKINAKEMKYLLLTLGERLNDNEIDEMIKETDISNQGGITYKDFVKLMLTK